MSDGTITQIGNGLAPAPVDLDVTGPVVTAGFVDLHSHVNDIAGLRLQALDGVTTALELEAGVTPVDAAYRAAAAEGRPVNYGFAASWALARMEVVGGIALDGKLVTSIGDLLLALDAEKIDRTVSVDFLRRSEQQRVWIGPIECKAA